MHIHAISINVVVTQPTPRPGTAGGGTRSPHHHDPGPSRRSRRPPRRQANATHDARHPGAAAGRRPGGRRHQPAPPRRAPGGRTSPRAARPVSRPRRTARARPTPLPTTAELGTWPPTKRGRHVRGPRRPGRHRVRPPCRPHPPLAPTAEGVPAGQPPWRRPAAAGPRPPSRRDQARRAPPGRPCHSTPSWIRPRAHDTGPVRVTRRLPKGGPANRRPEARRLVPRRGTASARQDLVLVDQPPAGVIRTPTVPVRPRRRVLRVTTSHPSGP
ncbi:hypothetical protein G443_001862 [Actinoalloteichus cyanogriseus DSM 43889]|uniref:Basic proline-rich protein n=1 Tax=Actinoalloteichus caeruleus DSM 43889 TaxID=1120930 RepID=A0ABT1JGF1_ACTCY|nr:hypothetical protein [Actinoalloteichus caeruleus DSM 43889]